MDFPDVWHEDTAKCHHCGTPTPRLYPPADIELCDSCWRAYEQETEIRRNNEAALERAVAEFFGLAN